MNYDEIMERGIRRTIISFDPFLKREDVRGLTDAQVGKKFGLATKTVKAMRLHQDVPFETIQILCHQHRIARRFQRRNKRFCLVDLTRNQMVYKGTGVLSQMVT